MSEDDAVKKRIRALMEKTTANGCTEEEAIAASQKVQQLLHKHQLNLSDLKIKETACREGEYEAQQKSHPMVWHCISAIAYFTDTKAWGATKKGWVVYKFFGLEHDVLIAEYITRICDWAIIWAGEDYKKTDDWVLATKSEKTKLKKDFQYGMAVRIAERLRKMKDEQRFDDQEKTGRDLVVVKNAVVEEEFEKLGLILKSTTRRGRNVDMGAYLSGRVAADKVALNPGVQKGETGQIK